MYAAFAQILALLSVWIVWCTILPLVQTLMWCAKPPTLFACIHKKQCPVGIAILEEIVLVLLRIPITSMLIDVNPIVVVTIATFHALAIAIKMIIMINTILHCKATAILFYHDFLPNAKCQWDDIDYGQLRWLSFECQIKSLDDDKPNHQLWWSNLDNCPEHFS